MKQTASIDHVCSLHQRLRSPLIPFRDGKTSSGGERTESGDFKCANQEPNEGGRERGKREIRAHTAARSEFWRPPPLARSRSLSHRREASIPTMTLASHPGADRHHQYRRRQHPPPLHHRRRRSCQEDARAVGARAAAGAGLAPGRPDRGRGRGRAAGAARRGPVQTDGSDGAGGRRRLGLAQSPVSYTTSSRSEQPLREDVQQQPSSLQPLGIFR